MMVRPIFLISFYRQFLVCYIRSPLSAMLVFGPPLAVRAWVRYTPCIALHMRSLSFSLSRGRHFIAVSEFLALKIVIFERCSAFGILSFKFSTH